MSDTPILHLKQFRYPHFRFEYHAAKKTVYIIRASAPTMGDPIAQNIETEGAAWNAALIWMRGYKEGLGELNVGKDKKEHKGNTVRATG